MAVLTGLVWRLCTDRVFGILRENNPELTGEKRRTIMKPPQARIEKTVLLEGCARLSAGSWSVRRPCLPAEPAPLGSNIQAAHANTDPRDGAPAGGP